MRLGWPNSREFNSKPPLGDVVSYNTAVRIALSCADSYSPRFLIAQLLAEFIPFLTSDFQVEHQVLDVQSQLRQGLLHQPENSPTATDGIDDFDVSVFEISVPRTCQLGNPATEVRQFLRNVVQILIGKS